MEARHDSEHISQAKTRWGERRYRRQESPDYREEWRTQQCGFCEFWIPFAGDMGYDYGGCSNPASPYDGMILFEHDGCEQYSPAEDWGVPSDFPP